MKVFHYILFSDYRKRDLKACGVLIWLYVVMSLSPNCDNQRTDKTLCGLSKKYFSQLFTAYVN